MAKKTGDTTTVIINRKRVLHSTLLATANTFNYFDTPIIVFTGEDGEDGGGPRREYFKLLMTEVSQRMGVFNVNNGKLYFTYNIMHLREGKYRRAGEFMRWSLIHGGPGLSGLSPTVFNLMTGSHVSMETHLTINDVPDIVARGNMNRIMNCTQDTFKTVITDLTDWLVDQGVCNVHSCTFNRRATLTHDLLTQIMYYRVQPAVMQFTEGLGEMWEDVRRKFNELRSLFVWKAAPPLTFTEFRKMYVIDYAPVGSNYRDLEEDSIYSFEVFLEKASSRRAAVSIQEVLEFWTGAYKVPPCGFPSDLRVEFYSKEPNVQRMPSSSTRVPVIRIPRGIEDPTELTKLMEYATQCAHGFGKI